jgi:hypothetical protein
MSFIINSNLKLPNHPDNVRTEKNRQSNTEDIQQIEVIDRLSELVLTPSKFNKSKGSIIVKIIKKSLRLLQK